jgi:hypothetical protein
MYEIEKFVPRDAIHLYKMMWQFEKWLRLMVYVELYARDNNWENAIKDAINESTRKKSWPPSSKKNDKSLYHMSTTHQSAISFLTLSELWNVISDDKNWRLFEKYFPPKDNTDARIKEIKNIRNRIMHFREPHENDVARASLFLKDFEYGVRLFCQSFTRKIYKDKEDELVKLLADHWDRVGYGVELWYLNSDHLYAPQSHRMDPKIHATLSLMRRPWSGTNGEGLLYEISISKLNHNEYFNLDFEDQKYYELDFEQMLKATEPVHDKCVHISIKGNGTFSAVFPAHLGVETNFTTISTILSAGVSCMVRLKFREFELERLSRQTPEYVLWPDNPLFWYDDSMTDSLINLNY